MAWYRPNNKQSATSQTHALTLMIYLTEFDLSGFCDNASGTPWYLNTTSTIITEIITSSDTCSPRLRMASGVKIKEKRKYIPGIYVYRY